MTSRTPNLPELGKLKGESSMLGKRINRKVCTVMLRKSCTHPGEAGQLPNPSFQWSKHWPVVAYLRRRHHNTHLFRAGATTFSVMDDQ